jgi:hypothetical protein
LTDAAFCENCGTDRDQYGQLDRRLFHRCASCRLEVCPDCWNKGRDLCLRCAPFSVGLAEGNARSAPVAGAASLPAAAPAAAWSLMAPDDSPGASVGHVVPGAYALPLATGATAATSAGEAAVAATAHVRDRLSGGRARAMGALGSLAGGLGKPLRLATHAVLLMCLTTLGLLVTWQLVSFAGTALPSSGAPGAAFGAAPTASPTASADPSRVTGSPQPGDGSAGGGDRGSSNGGDGSHGGTGATPTPRATPQPTPTPIWTPSGVPFPTPPPTPTAAPTPTDTPPPPPTDTPPPPPTDTPAPPPTDTPGP